MAHRITWLETGHSFDADGDEAVLSAARRSDVPFAYDCRSGGCGTCRVRIVEGAVRYEDDELPMGLSEEEAAAGQALLCQARACGDLVVSADVPDLGAPAQRMLARVEQVHALCGDVTRLCLELPVDADFRFRPGQYMNVHLPDGGHRSFSMASRPDGTRVDFHIRRIPGGRFTDAELGTLQPGDALEVELPLGSFCLRPQDYRPIVMLATGTGLAPLKAMLESLKGDEDCPPIHLYWGARTEADLYLDEAIRTWGDGLYEFNYVPVLSRAGAEWPGRRGHVQQAVLEDLGDQLGECAFYLCGSPAMIADAKATLAARGADPAFFYSDSFLFQREAVTG
ncbi:MAG: 2Fe-2S iron-sulfur cluster binding domain-containing protein [Hydrogenophaga sp.]|uniref:2Fe-2S iron-sulfur cluster-binding protein n=1 Tax=Hydrogenophaga sp. TaxID=1904254 RepID=UPI001D478C4D|nr:2Fe-2S iron-sulfur cluster-binding protein [Hydrogenophaga sp.]MBX3608755.1 2Fe-2S iron-sulfur cluster binding domain-containing protein [Hydrogenophaga sp.]